jgi:phosphate transport system substrate-binding protein
MSNRRAAFVALVAGSTICAPAAAMRTSDESLAFAGTDTMAPLLRSWIELFRHQHPEVSVRFEAGAPPTAAAGLAAGHIDIGYTGRTLWEPEIAAVRNARGWTPMSLPIAAGAWNDRTRTHAMAVFAHHTRALRMLSVERLRALFGGTGRRFMWGELDPAAPDAAQPVATHAAKLGTGATQSVREQALGGGSWAPWVVEHPSDDAAVAAVADDAAALCIAGLGHLRPGVRALAVGPTGAEVEPTFEHVRSRRYPLARLLYLHLAPAPSPTARVFASVALGEEAQAMTVAAGYLPLTAELVAHSSALLRRAAAVQ